MTILALYRNNHLKPRHFIHDLLGKTTFLLWRLHNKNIIKQKKKHLHVYPHQIMQSQ